MTEPRHPLHPSSPVQIGAQALAAQGPYGLITDLARDNGLRRQQVYEPRERAQTALEGELAPVQLPLLGGFTMDVIPGDMKCAVVALRVVTPASTRDIVEMLSVLYGTSWSYGKFWSVLSEAEGRAVGLLGQVDLSGIKNIALDGMFSQGRPVLAGHRGARRPVPRGLHDGQGGVPPGAWGLPGHRRRGEAGAVPWAGSQRDRAQEPGVAASPGRRAQRHGRGSPPLARRDRSRTGPPVEGRRHGASAAVPSLPGVERHREIENLNSVLRPCLVVQKHAELGFLNLFQDYWSTRKRQWGRWKGTSAHELLTGEKVADWLSMLGYPPNVEAAAAA